MRRIGIFIVICGTAVISSGFTPFTQVRNVCPKCPMPKLDLVNLLSGVKIRCNVVAQNSVYYVLERFGEFRALKKSTVASVEWKSKGPRALPAGDQIFLKNGHLLHGRISQTQPGRYFVIKIGQQRVTAWHSQVSKVFKGGLPVSFR